MGPKHTKRSIIATFCVVMFIFFFWFDPYFGSNSGVEIFKITVEPIISMKISNHDFLLKYWPNKKKVRKYTPQNVAIMLLLVCFGPIWVYFSGQKVNLKIFSFCLIVKFMISLYKLNTRGAGPISFYEFWSFGKSFSWHRHSICHYEWPTNSQFRSIRAA